MNKIYAFIDAQNLYLGLKSIGWKLDYKKFAIYLKEKHKVEKAYMFMGYLPENQQLYNFLESCGFILIFKPVIKTQNCLLKGNVDAELVLQAMIDINKYDKAIIVTGDGDFQCLVHYLITINKLHKVLTPSRQNCSILLIKASKGNLIIINDLKSRIEYKKEP